VVQKVNPRPPSFPYTEESPADGELLRRAAARDAAAFAAFYDRQAPRIFGLCLRMLSRREEAEDALQEAFLQAWRQASRFDPAAGAPGAWITVIARSRCLDRLRKRAVRRGTEEPLEVPGDEGDLLRPLPSGEAPALEALETAEARARAKAALASLPAEQRSALEASFYEGLSQSQIAARTGTPLGTVKTRMRRGLQKLAEMLR
jgi:RNA polymerase sigma-70 factor, ECF subfamily